MENKQPKVSILLLNYNGNKDTFECIDSLLKINYSNFDIWILDNNSTEKSSFNLKFLEKKSNKIHVIFSNENKGFSGGNNFLMTKISNSKISSDYFLLLNNDTTVKKDFLFKLVDFSEKNKKVGVVSPQVNKYSKKNQINFPDMSGKFNFWLGGGSPILPKKEFYKTDYNSGCCWLIKKEVFDKTNGFNENYFLYKEEIEWAYRINKLGYEFYVVPSSQIYHKGEQSTKKIKGLRQYYETKNSLFFVREHGKFSQKVFFIFYLFSYKLLKQLFLNFKSDNTLKKNNSFFRGIKDGFFFHYER